MVNIINEYNIKLFTKIGEKYYLCDDLADIYFIFEIGENSDEYERIPAHKLLLNAESDVFQTMFNGSWKEKTEVQIVDCSPNAFRGFLQFFYCNNVKLTSENIDEILYLGMKYNVAECLRVCGEFLKYSMTSKNLLKYLDLAIFYEKTHLRTFYEIILLVVMKEILTTKPFLECSKRVLSHILDLNALSCTEKELFDACMSWVREASGQTDLTKEVVSSHLGGSFYKIRFGAMSLDEFNTIQSSYEKLFSTDEQSSIVELIVKEGSKSNMFSAVSRLRDFKKQRDFTTTIMPLLEHSQHLSCNREVSANRMIQPYFVNKTESTLFTSSACLILTGFTCSFSTLHNSKYDDNLGGIRTRIKILEHSRYGRGYECWSRTVVLSTGITRIDEIIANIRAGSLYEIRMEQDPPKNYCTGHLLKCEVQLADDITVNFHRNPQIGRTHLYDMGPIRELFFAKF